MNNNPFFHNSLGKGRPQILLIGNGVERVTGQLGWGQLLDDLCAPGRARATKEQKNTTPFPLLYQLLSTPPACTVKLERNRDQRKRKTP